jgi:hypothetical protein
MRQLALLLVLGSTLAFSGGASRIQCCHGCGSYYCNAKNCGDKCDTRPRCHGCWKSCHQAQPNL